jgi:hypothetical protein
LAVPDLAPWLIGSTLVALAGFLYWAEGRYPSPSKPRGQACLLAFCAWCIYRNGVLTSSHLAAVLSVKQNILQCRGIQGMTRPARPV